MLKIVIPATEQYDELNNEFFNTPETVLELEHSLVSLSRWESEFCRPFLTSGNKTHEETIGYIRCMTLRKNVDPDLYKLITNDIIAQVSTYIEAPMTATTFSSDDKKTINREVVTAEIIYYWMIALNIPFSCEKWHLNRLITLINVCNIKNQPTKKMSKKDLLARNRALNEARKARLNTTG